MKALTLTQPWATLVAIGAKKIETRSWSTSYRGPLAIHAAKSFPKNAQYLCFSEPFRKILVDKYSFFRANEIYFGKHQLPLGCVIATCELINVRSVGSGINHHGWGDGIHVWSLTEQERAFGDYTLGRYVWLFNNIQLLPEPIPAKGAPGLWEWNDNDYEEKLRSIPSNEYRRMVNGDWTP